MNANQVFYWRKLYREGRLGGRTATQLLPVKVTDSRGTEAREEYGLARLQAEFQKRGKQPLGAICQSLQESVAKHGRQFDDQSLFLIRKT